MKALNAHDRSELYALEERADKGLADAAKALTEIRRKKLYRGTHQRWEDYCRERWGKSKRHIDRLISAGAVIEQMGPNGSRLNERQARALAEADPAVRPALAQAAAEQDLSAKDISTLTREVMQALPRDEQRALVERGEDLGKRLREARVTKGGDGRAERLKQIHRLYTRLHSLVAGIGPEAEEAVQRLEAFYAALHGIEG